MDIATKPVFLTSEIVKAAREWLGTQFHHQGRLRASTAHKGGCDCLGLLVGVAEELGLKDRDGRPLAHWDVRGYGHLPDGERMRHIFEQLFSEVPVDALEEGDLLLMRFERAPQHVAIVSQHPDGGWGIIHALASARRVVEHRLDEVWRDRIVAAYRVADMV